MSRLNQLLIREVRERRIKGKAVNQFSSKSPSSSRNPDMCLLHYSPRRELQAMEALQNGQTTVEGSMEGQSAGAASHAMIEKILREEPRWQGKGGHTVATPLPPAACPLPCPPHSLPEHPPWPSPPQTTTSPGRPVPPHPTSHQPPTAQSCRGTPDPGPVIPKC